MKFRTQKNSPFGLFFDPAAILSDEFFDAKDVIINSVIFAETSPERGNYEDVDKDGDLDLILHFNTQSLEISVDAIEAVLTGELIDGTLIKGTDSIKVVPGKIGKK